MKEDKPLILWGFFIIFFASILCFGIYSDYQYKMKKLDLIEKGFIKTQIEVIK